jgi:hypothetical protein
VLWAAAIALVLAPPKWEPRPPEPPTAWAQAGSRPWGQCRDLERGAERILAQAPAVTGERGPPSPWPDRAKLCPGSPAVLVAAAQAELVQAPEFPPLSELAAQVEALGEAQRTSRKRAARWLAAARTEASRRGEAPPPWTWYLTGWAALGLGEAERAREALLQAEARGEAPPWWIDRLLALTSLLQGDLTRALELAHRARELGPARDREMSTLILALVYDRAGAPEAAMRELAAQQSGYRSPPAGLLDTYLPLHERLYVAALEQMVARQTGNVNWLLKAYLACPEPAAPERKLVQRRIDELRPK